MRFHIGLSLNWKTLKKWILPILIGILVFLGLSSVNAETLDDTTSWTIIRYQNSSGTTLVTYNCPSPNAYSDDYCTYSFLYPDSPANYQFELVFRFTTQPFVFKANTDYKITIYATDIVDYSKIKIAHELSSGAYSSYVSPKNVSTSGNKITMTLSYSSDVSAKTIVLKIPLVTNGSAGETVYMGISRNFTIYDVDDSGSIIIDQNEIIIDQNKETNEKLDETNDKLEDLEDSITNPNVDSDTGNDFFNNFQTEDNGGISGIITAPLTLINSLLDGQGTCTDLTFSIMGKEVALPSGCIIWEKVPNEMEILIQTLVCGTGAYFLLRQLFKDIEKLKNPNNSEVSTLDL